MTVEFPCPPTSVQTYTDCQVEIWPKAADRQSAVEAARASAGICYFVAAVTGCAAIISIFSEHKVLGVDGWGLFDAGMFTLFGWRIWKLSRVFAVLGLVLYCAEAAYKLADGGGSPASLIMILFIWGLIQGIRGTFAYKRFQPITTSPEENPGQAGMPQEGRIKGWILKGWKRWAIIGASIGTALAATLALIVWSVDAYTNRTSEVKQWPTLQISSTAAEVKLKTQWKGGLRYVLTATPSSTEMVDQFNDATSDMSQVGFTFVLYDQSGFQVCRVDVDTPTTMVGNEGKRVSLESNGESISCSADNYREATKWSIDYKFPQLKRASISDWEVVGPETKIASTTPAKAKEPGEGDDVITGNDFGGHLDAEHSRFYVSRSGEQMSSISWGSDTKIHFKCDGGNNCVIENMTSGGTLHAHRTQ
jgi:hypothetical protein